MEKIYQRPKSQMYVSGLVRTEVSTWIIGGIIILPIYHNAIPCSPRTWQIMLIIYAAQAILFYLNKYRLHFMQYYIKIYDDRIVFSNILKKKKKREYLFKDISLIVLGVFRSSYALYSMQITRQDGTKKRHEIDGVDPRDFRDLVQTLQACGVKVEFKNIDLTKKYYN